MLPLMMNMYPKKELNTIEKILEFDKEIKNATSNIINKIKK